jgi:hypothetical protein
MLKGKAFLFVSCLSPFAKARPPCFPGTHGELNEIAMCVCFPQFQLPLAQVLEEQKAGGKTQMGKP